MKNTMWKNEQSERTVLDNTVMDSFACRFVENNKNYEDYKMEYRGHGMT